MKSALTFYWPLLLLIALQLGVTGYLMVLGRPECELIFGINSLVIALLMFCFLVPGTLMLGACYLGYISYRALQSGRFPPAGIPGFKNSRVRTGTQARVSAIVGLLSPLLALAVIGLGITAYTGVVGNQGIEGFQAEVEAECRLAGSGGESP